MGKLYSLLIKSSLLLIGALAFNHSIAISLVNIEPGDTPKTASVTVRDTQPDRPVVPDPDLSNSLIQVRPFTLMGGLPGQMPLQTDTSSLLNVKVYPVPVADQVNVSYHVKKESNVTILLMDLLGNKLMTLFSKRVPAGDQNNMFSLRPRVERGGFYFIKVIVGTQQPVTKRILVL